MIAAALMIMVIGDSSDSEKTAHMPWNIEIQNNGTSRVFGITLGKTQLQDANQILAQYPETHFIPASDNMPARLVSVYDELNTGGLLASIELEYELEQSTLAEYEKSALTVADKPYLQLSDRHQMQLLSATIKTLIYKPAIDYELDVILQRFGPATEQLPINDSTQRWLYPELGLDIMIDSAGPDTFIYTAIAATAPEPAE